MALHSVIAPALIMELNILRIKKDVRANCYCARNSCRNAVLRHARARAQSMKSILMKGWYPLR